MFYDEITATKMSYPLNSGYWKVSEHCFFNKAEALRYASSINHPTVTYHFFDDAYSSIDWTKDSDKSLDQLYKERAEQLRNQYKYIIVAFSGGSDSTNVVRSFLNNGIHIDEIISSFPLELANKKYQSFDPNDKSCGNVIFELYESVLPALNEIKQKYPKTKITLIDCLENMNDLVRNKDINLLDTSGVAPAAISGLHYSIFKKFDNTTKDCCIIYAIDKPNLRYNFFKNTFEAHFFDFLNYFGKFTTDLIGTSIPKAEYFYYSPNFPILAKEQARVLAKGLSGFVKPRLYFTKLKKEQKSVKIDPNSDTAKKLLYSDNWNTSIYQARKTVSKFYNQQTDIFWNELEGSVHEKFSKELDTFLHGIDNRFLIYDKYNNPTEFIRVNTKGYGLNIKLFSEEERTSVLINNIPK